MKKIILFFIFLSQLVRAQAPAYYNDINIDQTGSALKAVLAGKITTTHTNPLNYDDIESASKITDENPDNAAQVLLIYGYEDGSDGETKNDRAAGKDNHGTYTGSDKWNKEHVYSNSLATPDLDSDSENGAPYADAHNLRPCNYQINSTRGNRKFSNSTGDAGDTGESYTNTSGGTQEGWYPGDEWRGDVARMMMYMYLRYGSRCLPTNVGLGSSSGTDDDMIDLFLEWNAADQVSAFELQRNTYHDSDGTYAQGNRNPFIDNPHFATLIWGGPLAEDKFGDVTDSENPTAPDNVASSLITGTSFSISWTASTDNAFVTGYKIVIDDVEVATTSTTNYSVTGRTVSTPYAVTIKAYDPSGNVSPGSTSINVTTGADNTLASDLFISEYIEGTSNNKALEIVNYTGSSIDLSAYTLKKQTNGSGSWSTSPLSLSGTLVNGEVYVIANSSADAAILSQADSTPSSAVLSFNGNDPIGLFKDDVLIDIVGVFDGGSGNNFGENRTLQRKFSVTSPADPFNTNEWITLATDTFTRLGAHTVTGTNTFLELTDTNWNEASNWSFNSIPSSGDNIIVRANKTINTTGNITLGNLTVETNAAFNISSGGSLIVAGTSSGTITYTRTLSENWHLVASPVVGQEINTTWADANGIASSGIYRGIAGYITQFDTWLYAQDGQSGETFQSGIGYAIKRTEAGTVSVTGTINTDNETETLTTTGNGYNLLGNPYPSYINSASILTANTNDLDSETIWIWNQATASYDTKVTVDAFKIAPGQGFFVKSDGASGNVSMLESYQSHESDTFQRPQVNPEIYLTLTDDSKSRLAKIYYIEGTTTSFDNGYDGEMFGATSSDFAIYTHLVGNEQGQVGNSQGHGYAVQSLPTDNYENMIIPVGINATRGTTINIEATLNNFPEGINVYLADKQENSVTLLETDTSYSTTLEEDHNGVGRFYIHTTPNALSSGEVLDSIPLSIYSLDSEILHIEGVATGTAYLQLYTMLGKELLQTSFEGTGVNEILLPNHLNPGIYIVKIATATGVTTKKIRIQ